MKRAKFRTVIKVLGGKRVRVIAPPKRTEREVILKRLEKELKEIAENYTIKRRINMEQRKFKFGGKTIWKKIKGRPVRVQLPPENGPVWEDVKPIFDKIVEWEIAKRKTV